MDAANDCDCLILCGGLGQRLQPVIGDSQKVMARIRRRPFLEILLDELEAQGMGRVVLAAGYKSDSIEEYFSCNRRPLTIDIVKEPGPLGTGGAVKFSRAEIRTPRFFVFNGDSFCRVNLPELLAFHLGQLTVGSLVLVRAPRCEDFGSVAVDGRHRITAFREKQAGSRPGWVNAGVYCFERQIFDLMPGKEAFSIEKDFFPQLTDGRLSGFCLDAELIDIGTPERFREAQKKLGERS